MIPSTTHVVLSINSLLGTDWSLTHNPNEAAFFQNRGAVVSIDLARGRLPSVEKTYYLFPGAIEFIKRLSMEPGVKISFFSLRPEAVTLPLVQELFRLACPEKSASKILSKEHLTETSGFQQMEQDKNYGVEMGNNHKDLTKLLAEGESLEQVVNIEEDISYVGPDQMRNTLYAVNTETYHFSGIAKKCDNYSADGIKFVHMILQLEFARVQLKSGYTYRERYRRADINRTAYTAERPGIVVTQSKFGFEFLFLHQSGVMQDLLLRPNDSPLYEELTEACSTLLEKTEPSCLLENAKHRELMTKIANFVEERGGVARGICKRANRIYYAAGLFFSALEQAKKDQVSVPEVLFKRQFAFTKESTYKGQYRIPEKIENVYRGKYKALLKKDELYYLGLKELQKANPELTFTNPHNYINNTCSVKCKLDLID